MLHVSVSLRTSSSLLVRWKEDTALTKQAERTVSWYETEEKSRFGSPRHVERTGSRPLGVGEEERKAFGWRFDLIVEGGGRG